MPLDIFRKTKNMYSVSKQIFFEIFGKKRLWCQISNEQIGKNVFYWFIITVILLYTVLGLIQDQIQLKIDHYCMSCFSLIYWVKYRIFGILPSSVLGILLLKLNWKKQKQVYYACSVFNSINHWKTTYLHVSTNTTTVWVIFGGKQTIKWFIQYVWVILLPIGSYVQPTHLKNFNLLFFQTQDCISIFPH